MRVLAAAPRCQGVMVLFSRMGDIMDRLGLWWGWGEDLVLMYGAWEEGRPAATESCYACYE